MRINRLIVSNFRNLGYVDIKPSPGFNVIYGKNGAGKTSILEAVSFLAVGRSFRGGSLSSLVKQGEERFSLFAAVSREDDPAGPETRLGVSRGRRNGEGEIALNGNRNARLSDIIRHICVQVIHPMAAELITGSPEERRHFMDWGLFYHFRDAARAFGNYRKVLAHRNQLLRENAPAKAFTVWNTLLSELAESITELRREYLEILSGPLNAVLGQFLPEMTLSFDLSPGWAKDKPLEEVLESGLERDKALNYTFSGSHRADLRVKVNGQNAAWILSRGQLKLLVCALRLAQAQSLREKTGMTSIFLIDDMGAELDERSRKIFTDNLTSSQSQIFMTNIELDAASRAFSGVRCFEMAAGEVASVTE